MKPSRSSLINISAYRHYQGQLVQKWLIRILSVTAAGIMVISLIFNNAVHVQESTQGPPSLATQTEIFRKVTSPALILTVLFFLILAAHAASRYIRLHGAETSKAATVVNIQEENPFGPAFLASGVHTIIVMKNYQGFLHILRPLPLAHKDLYFFPSSEKVDQVINLQTQATGMPIHCRTLDGISIVLPNVQIHYRCMLSDPGSHPQTSMPASGADGSMIKEYLLKKGERTDQENVRLLTEQVILNILRNITLDELNGNLKTDGQQIAEEKSSQHFRQVKQYKINALSKHWRNKKMLQTLANHSSRQHNTFQHFRKHRKQYHPARQGIFTFSCTPLHKDNPQTDPFAAVESRIREALGKELNRFNIRLISLQIAGWQPAETLVKQKIQQTQEKKIELFLSQKAVDARAMILEAKNASLADLQKSNPFSPSPSDHHFSNADLSSAGKEKTYRIPPILKKE